MRNATRISCHRRDDGSIVGEYEPCDRISLKDIDLMVDDMLMTVDDNGEHSYEWSISPEVVTIQKVGTLAVLEVVLTSSTLAGRMKHTPGGLGADELRSIRRGWQT